LGLKIFATSLFVSDINKLTKKEKLGYSSILNDIHSFLKKHNTFALLWNTGIKITESSISKIIKVRIENSKQRRGRSSAFRLYYIANKVKEEICFLHVYPKTGKLRKSNVDKQELKKIKSAFIEELKTNTLVEFEKHFS